MPKETIPTVKAKRGPKTKVKEIIASPITDKTIEDQLIDPILDNFEDINVSEIIEDMQIENDVKQSKKRGRKPKGGKIIQPSIIPFVENTNKPSIMLHLKCSLKDMLSSNVDAMETYDFVSNKLSYDVINYNIDAPVEIQSNSEPTDYSDKDNEKEICSKLKELQYNLHMNNITDKSSACFWCTCDFDNPRVYIPKHKVNNEYQVYGCFCSPECATAFLMDENIDVSTKFERYHLLNHIYAKIYNYNKNIKPAPNPYYMLDKYYGNLSIQEYRSLFKKERLYLIVDKPLTRILPELYEDNDDFILNTTIIQSNAYQVKKNLKKSQSKNIIVNEKFGIV